MVHQAIRPAGGFRNSRLHRSLLRGTRAPVSYSAHGHLFHALQGLRAVTCDQDGNCYDDSTGSYSAGPVTLADVQASAGQGDCVYGTDASGSCLPGSTSLIPYDLGGAVRPGSTAMPGVAALASQLIASGTQLATPLVAAAARQQPYYVTNPQTGQSVLYNPNTGTAAAAPGGFSSSVGSSGGFVLLALALGGAVLLGGRR